MSNKLLTTLCSAAFIASTASYAQVEMPQAAAAPQENTMAMPTQPVLPVARNGEVIDSVGGGATEAILPGMESSNGISYLTGGIGDEELAEINAQMENFNTRILMSSANGEYMGDVSLVIAKDGTEILKLDNSGPFLLVNLPEGAYTYNATSYAGTVKSGKFNVSNKVAPTGKTVIVFNE